MNQIDCLDIMLDVETLGNSNNPVITQLAAVPFNLKVGVLGDDSFNEFIKPQSAKKYGLTCDPSNMKIGTTLDFWLTQDEEVFKNVILKAFLEGKDLKEVLEKFSQWIENLKVKYNCKKVKIYGNGPAADCVWVRSAYNACGLDLPWNFWDDQCVRTFVDISVRAFNFNPKKDMKFEGEKHNALDDCKHQIKYVCAIFRKISRLE